jgi:DNA polymerase elongation subunit (family B)
MEPYLKNHIELKLKARKDLKELIKHEKHPETKQNHEIKAELIKLMLNSCYGFTLCNLTSSKF